MTARRPNADHNLETWRQRSEVTRGSFGLDRSPTITASEIGSFAFCPQAWYLQRCRVPVTAEADLRRKIGSRAHRQIGRQTDLIRATNVAQWLLLVTMFAAMAFLIAPLLRVLP